jgi:hypothetical protein
VITVGPVAACSAVTLAGQPQYVLVREYAALVRDDDLVPVINK